MHPIAITGSASISAAGENCTDESSGNHFLTFDEQLDAWVGKLPKTLKAQIEAIREENRNYQALDPSVLYAMYIS